MQLLTSTVVFDDSLFDLDTLSRAHIEEILHTSDSMKEVLSREIQQVPVLRGKTVLIVFCQKNEPVRASFELAAQALSARVVTLNYDGQAADECQSLIGMARTLQGMGAHIAVLRHHQAGFPYQVSHYFQGTLINAGDGNHADPSQAMVDLFTIREKLNRIDRVKVVLIGDILHSGTARSCLWGLTRMGARVTLCAPPTLLGPSKYWQRIWPDVRIVHKLDEVIEGVDVIKFLPVSSGCFSEGMLPSVREYKNLYGITEERLQRAKKHALILPPVASVDKTDIVPELFTPPQVIVEDQVTNGIAVRMALLYLLSGQTNQ